MHILITGGTGFIGQYLLKALSKENHTIIVLTRNKKPAKQQLPFDFIFINSLSEVDFNTLDIVINLAGENIADKRWTKEQKNYLCTSRWELTRKLTDKISAAETPPSCFISGSAVGYYGRQDNTKITEKTHTIHNEFTHKLCKEWERIALTVTKHTRVCILRTGIVLGAQHGALNKMILPFKLGLGGKVASGEQYMSWIHITDMVNAIIYLANHKNAEGIYNITAPKAVNNHEFTQTLSKNLNRPCIFPMPKVVLKTLLGEMSDLLLCGQNVYPEKLLDEGFIFSYPELDMALKNLLP